GSGAGKLGSDPADGIFQISVDGASVYYRAESFTVGAAIVRTFPKTGGSPVDFGTFATNPTDTLLMAASAPAVYWTNPVANCATGAKTEIYVRVKSGGAQAI